MLAREKKVGLECLAVELRLSRLDSLEDRLVLLCDSLQLVLSCTVRSRGAIDQERERKVTEGERYRTLR